MGWSLATPPSIFGSKQSYKVVEAVRHDGLGVDRNYYSSTGLRFRSYFNVPFVPASQPGKDTPDTRHPARRSVDRSLRCDISMIPEGCQSCLKRTVSTLALDGRGKVWSTPSSGSSATCVVRLVCRLSSGRVHATCSSGPPLPTPIVHV